MNFKNIKGDYFFTERVNDGFYIDFFNKLDNKFNVRLYSDEKITNNVYFQRCIKIVSSQVLKIDQFYLMCEGVKKYSINNFINCNHILRIVHIIFLAKNNININKFLKKFDDLSDYYVLNYIVYNYKCKMNIIKAIICLVENKEIVNLICDIVGGVNSCYEVDNYCLNVIDDNNFIHLYKLCKFPSQEHTNKYNLLTL